MSVGGGKKQVNIPSEQTSLTNPITYYRDRTGTYPSNAQIWWAMKRPPEVGTDRPPKQYLEVFDPSLRHQIYVGNTPAPKGHYVLRAFQQDRSSASGVTGIDVDSSKGARPQAIAFYAGRVFYAGTFTAGYNTNIYFSQILERPEQVGECYQQQDPTAEDLRDLLPSDGGVLSIPAVTQVFHLFPVERDLFVFCDNGVWKIGGSSGSGFQANDFSVTKVSGAPTVSHLSFVDVEGIPIWWNRTSINTLVPNDAGMLSVQSLTDNTIKEFYNAIPEQSKEFAKGTYDPLTRTVQFLYRSTETSDNRLIFNYDRVLVLDTRSGAWYPWNFPTADRIDVKGIFTKSGIAVEQTLVEVFVGEEQVLANTDEVFAIFEDRKPVQSKIKYLVNIKDETDLPAPPELGTELDTEEVYADLDQVYVDTDLVVITL